MPVTPLAVPHPRGFHSLLSPPCHQTDPLILHLYQTKATTVRRMSRSRMGMTMEAVPAGGRHGNSQSLEMGTAPIWGWPCPHFQHRGSHPGVLDHPQTPHGRGVTHCPPLTAALLLAHDEILAARTRHPRGTPGSAGRAAGLAGQGHAGREGELGTDLGSGWGGGTQIGVCQ